MQIPDKLKERLLALGVPESVYEMHSRKCILSRDFPKLDRVPWYRYAFYIDEDFDNKKDVFVFDPVSLVPCLALAPEKDDKILDMCAAPGTKTFIMSFLTNNEAKIVANDIDRFRVKRLRYNINKFNISAEVFNLSGRKIDGSFDKILLDAPCSGEGMINKNRKVFQIWSERRVKLMAKRQKKLIVHAFDLLEKNGMLVYSTCTFGPEENEEVVDFLLSKRKDADIEPVEIKNIIHASGLTAWDGKEYDSRVARCLRIYPQHNGTGGFFVAKIKNKS